MQQGGFERIEPELLGEVVSGLGILAKNPTDGKLQFRREYLQIIMDIINGDGFDKPASSQRMPLDKDLENKIQIPKFAHAAELAAFLEGDRRVRYFIINSIKSGLSHILYFSIFQYHIHLLCYHQHDIL